LFEEGVELVGLAPEPNDQNAPGIRVAREGGEKRSGSIKVVAELGTTEWMLECVDAVDRFRMACVRNRCDPLRRSSHAPDGRKNPDFVPGTDAAIFPLVTAEMRILGSDQRRGLSHLVEMIAFDAAEHRFHIVRVDVRARGDGCRGAADRPAKFSDDFPFGEVTKSELVADLDQVSHSMFRAGDLDDGTRFDGFERDGDVILRVDSDSGGGSLERFAVSC